MTNHHDRLGVKPGDALAEIKAAYHAKLREFPAHTHPQEFKEIRTAYEVLQKSGDKQFEDLLKVRRIETSLDPEAIAQLRQRALSTLEVSFEDAIRMTF